MSYIVEQKINNRVYLYEVEAYWDKEKGQSRQRRKYLGVKDPVTGLPKTPRKGIAPKAVLEHGKVWLLGKLAENIHLKETLRKAFGGDWKKVFDLACFDLLEDKGFHLYGDWAESAWDANRELRTSQDISRFFKGLDERSIRLFQNFWLRRHGGRKAVAFDITSISSYSDGMDSVEWGYNRDGERLPQVNMGLAVNCESGVPVAYRLFPGSLPDVRTLTRLVDEFKSQVKLEELVLDRGFHSEMNIKRLVDGGVDFLMGLPFNSKHARKMLAISRVDRAENAFVFNGRHVFSTTRRVNAGGRRCDVHLFLDEERRACEARRFFNKIDGVERHFEGAPFSRLDDLRSAVESFSKGMAGYFTLEVVAGKAVLARDTKKMDERMKRMGKMVLISSRTGRSSEEVLEAYYRRDIVEKYFDALKNKMGNDRLRTHSDSTAKGRMFVAVIGLLLYSALFTAWKKSKLRAEMPMTSVLSAMGSLKAVERSDGAYRLTEITKKQRRVIKELGLTPPVM
jgi:hypothetical protein